MEKLSLRTLILIFLTVGMLQATTFAPTTLKKLTKSSTLIVTAKVERVESQWDNNHEKIFTLIDVKVMDVIKGQNVPDIIQIEQLGGKVGDKALIIHSAPVFEEGDEVLLFLVFHKNKYWVHSLAMGKYDIINEGGKKVALNKEISNDLVKLETESVTNMSADYQKYPLEQFLNQVRLYNN